MGVQMQNGIRPHTQPSLTRGRGSKDSAAETFEARLMMRIFSGCVLPLLSDHMLQARRNPANLMGEQARRICRKAIRLVAVYRKEELRCRDSRRSRTRK